MKQHEFDRLLRQVEREIKLAANEQVVKEIRARFRAENGYYYVGTYTVHAHLRRMPESKVKRAIPKSKVR